MIQTSTPKKDSKRKFFKTAALLANPNVPNDNNLTPSKFLEHSFQEQVFKFHSDFDPILREHTDRVHYASGIAKLERAFNLDAKNFFNAEAIFHKTNLNPAIHAKLFDRPQKFVYRNGQVFFPEEIASLIFAFIGFSELDSNINQLLWLKETPMSAISFHNLLGLNKHLVLSAHVGKNFEHTMINQINLHWAHRLKQKSSQNLAGTEPNTKYFHAELNNLNILYWIKFDQNEQACAGDFIQSSTKIKDQINIFDLWIPHQQILHKLTNKNLESSLELVFSKVLSVYVESLI